MNQAEPTGTHASPRPHIRRAHWHSFWVGKKDQPDAEVGDAQVAAADPGECPASRSDDDRPRRSSRVIKVSTVR